MKKLFVFSLIFWGALGIMMGQVNLDDKRDYQWCFGTEGNYPIAGRSVLSFLNFPPDTFAYSSDSRISFANSGISDNNGNLLFYSNYFRVIDKTHQTMMNGDSLNCCTNFFSSNYPLAANATQIVLCLTYPSFPNLYYIFHQPFNPSCSKPAINC